MPETLITAAREEHKYYPYQGIFYLSRRSFWQAGADGFTQPPAQNPDMFPGLANIEPVLQGNLQRRRGYTLFSNQTPASPFTLGYSFRNDILGLRSVVFTSPSTVIATTEGGANYLNPIFTPSPGSATPRMVLSRNFGYFADGLIADNKKWDGTTPTTSLTNWGIPLNTSSTAPTSPTSATDLGGQGGGPGSAGPNSAGVNNTGSGTVAGNHHTTLIFAASNFGFNIPPLATIVGIKVVLNKTNDGSGSTGAPQLFLVDNLIQLQKAGISTGANHSTNGSWGTGNPVVSTYGNSSDLWGASWTPADINNTGFGFQFQAIRTDSSALTDFFHWSSVQITIFYTGGSVFSWTNVTAVESCGAAVATATASVSPSSDIQATGFGFAVGGSITGIQVAIAASTSGGPINVNPVLDKGGSPVGFRKSLPTTSSGLTTLVFGGQFDLWGSQWLPTDINASNFGVQIGVTASGSATVSINCLQVTIFTQAGPLTVGAPVGGGSITLLSGRTYFYVFQNSKTTATSTLGPASTSTGPVTNASSIPLSGIPTPSDPQADTVLILATADGNDQTTLFLVGSVTSGTATFTDTTSDTVLLTQPLYQNTDAFGNLHGVANNLPPPSMLFPVKHKGRIYGAKGSTLYFSKNLDEVTTANGLTTSKWEEAWPASNSLDISETAETIKGLLSDGETLWIATERAIRRLIGDSPQNFQKPEIQFNETGILNQDVWKIVFHEGQPVGTMWLTPDLRIISSDFNTYRDVGGPVQDLLNVVDTSVSFGPHAAFVSKGPADYFMLYLPVIASVTPPIVGPGPSVILVYNLRTQKWFLWVPTDSCTGSLFFIDASGNPRWLFNSGTGPIYEWTAGTYQDRIGTSNPVSYSSTIRTSWLDFGDANLRKSLNQFLYLGTDTALTVQVDGAILDSELDTSPFPVLPPTTVVTGPLDDLYVPLAQTTSKHRWYRFTLTSPPSTQIDVLDGFSVEAYGLFRY